MDYRGLLGLDPRISGREQPSFYRDVEGEFADMQQGLLGMLPMGGIITAPNKIRGLLSAPNKIRGLLSARGKSSLSKRMDDLVEMTDEGINTEHSDVAKNLFEYTHNLKSRGITDAVESISYPVYKQDITGLLKAQLGDKFNVYRVPGYATRPYAWKGPNKPKQAYESWSYFPHWGKTKKGRMTKTVSPDDVVALGHSAEGEVILKSK